MPPTPSNTAVKTPRGRASWLLLLAAAGIAGYSGGCSGNVGETPAGAEVYSETSDSSNGRTMKRIELAEGITVAIPRNFPRPAKWDDGDVKVISYSMRPHEGASRFLHFFEIRLSLEEPAPDRILKDLGYQVGDQQTEEITADGRKGTLTTTAITIPLPCGTTQDATCYSWTYYCTVRKRHVLIATFTMMRDGFLEIVKSLRCS